MSKKITHEQARQHLKDKIKDGNILTVLEYIKQQEELEQQHSYDIKILGQIIEKQKKLLELYKEKDKLKDFFAMGSIRAEKYKKIEKQIKELENEISI